MSFKNAIFSLTSRKVHLQNGITFFKRHLNFNLLHYFFIFRIIFIIRFRLKILTCFYSQRIFPLLTILYLNLIDFNILYKVFRPPVNSNKFFTVSSKVSKLKNSFLLTMTRFFRDIRRTIRQYQLFA
jgi:hypothetical protein